MPSDGYGIFENASNPWLGLGVPQSGAEHAADILGLAIELGAADFEHARVIRSVLGESDAGGVVERAFAGADRIENDENRFH